MSALPDLTDEQLALSLMSLAELRKLRGSDEPGQVEAAMLHLQAAREQVRELTAERDAALARAEGITRARDRAEEREIVTRRETERVVHERDAALAQLAELERAIMGEACGTTHDDLVAIAEDGRAALDRLGALVDADDAKAAKIQAMEEALRRFVRILEDDCDKWELCAALDLARAALEGAAHGDQVK